MRKKILLIEDDLSISQTLGRVLEMGDHEVVLAQTARKAVSRFLDETPNLILLDLDLPDEDGWQTFEQMEELHPLVPIIVITGHTEQFEHASEVGIDALMPKPLDIELLLRAVEELLAEPDSERLARLTRPSFTTRLLTAEKTQKVEIHSARDWGINE